MENIGEILARFLSGEATPTRHPHGPVFERWVEVVGPQLASKCKPVALKKGTLFVHVTDSVWMQELQMQKVMLLDRIRELFGSNCGISDMRLTIGGGTRAIKKTKTGKPPKKIKKPPSRPLTDEEKAWIKAVSSQVSDSDLKKTVRRILKKHILSEDQP